MVDGEAGRQMIFDSPDFTHSHQIYIYFFCSLSDSSNMQNKLLNQTDCHCGSNLLTSTFSFFLFFLLLFPKIKT